MADYPVKMSKRVRNLAYMRDGNVWVNYLLLPPTVNIYDEDSVSTSQAAHEELFNSLHSVDSDDYMLGGFLARTPDQEVLSRIVQGIPDYSDENYPEAREHLQAFARQLRTGYLNERHRIYWLSVRYPSVMSFWSRLSGSIFDSDPFEGTSDSDVVKFENKVFSSIPSVFRPVRTEPEHFDWIVDRASMRGVQVPDSPEVGGRAVSPGSKSYPEVLFDEAAVGTSMMSEFITRMREGDPELTDINSTRESFRNNFRDIRNSDILKVTRPDTRNDQFPDGVSSYQGVFAISRYAPRNDYEFQNFTGIVDQATGLDADFAIRFNYAPYMSDNTALNKTLKNMDDEDSANTRSTLDAEDYEESRGEVRSFHRAVRSDRGAVPMRVTTIFAFGSANLAVAKSRMRSIRQTYKNSGFQTLTPTGGKTELWKMMLPGSASTSLVSDLHGLTTPRLFGGYAPLRRYQLGDGVGIPFAVNIGNALGQIVHLDLLNPTLRGNASLALTGAQGKGKSHGMKILVEWMNDLRLHTASLDPHGEWATYVQSFESRQVIDLAEPTVSIDVLKIIDDPKRASEMLVDLLIPMFGVAPDSEVAAAFTKYVSPEARQLHPERNTTRGVLESIAAAKDITYKPIMGTIHMMLDSPTMGAFVDPEVMGRVEVLPPANLTARNIVFLTRGLKLPPQDTPVREMKPLERYTLLVNTAVAMITDYHFDRIKSTAAFIGDEMSFYDGHHGVLKPLMQDKDRAGRKFGKFIIAGSQTAKEFMSDEYRLVRKRIALGQEKADNSIEALGWADFPTDSHMVDQHLYDTSPLDPDTDKLPKAGREGEGYFNDGVDKGRIRILPHFRSDRARASDTRTTTFQRYEGEVVDSRESVSS